MSVRVYNPAKTVADCFKYRNKVGIDVAIEALKECWRSRRCEIEELVFFVSESKPRATDDDVLALAFNERRILITEDKDFGELVYRLEKPARGIISISLLPVIVS